MDKEPALAKGRPTEQHFVSHLGPIGQGYVDAESLLTDNHRCLDHVTPLNNATRALHVAESSSAGLAPNLSTIPRSACVRFDDKRYPRLSIAIERCDPDRVKCRSQCTGVDLRLDPLDPKVRKRQPLPPSNQTTLPGEDFNGASRGRDRSRATRPTLGDTLLAGDPQQEIALSFTRR